MANELPSPISRVPLRAISYSRPPKGCTRACSPDWFKELIRGSRDMQANLAVIISNAPRGEEYHNIRILVGELAQCGHNECNGTMPEGEPPIGPELAAEYANACHERKHKGDISIVTVHVISYLDYNVPCWIRNRTNLRDFYCLFPIRMLRGRNEPT